MKATLILFPIAILAIGCSSGANEAAASPDSFGSSSTPMMEEGKRGSQSNEAGGVAKLVSDERPAMNRNVVKTGSLTVQVEDVDTAEKRARQIAESAGGRVDQVKSTDLAGPDAVIDMTLRVPVARFESAMEQFQALGVRLQKQVSADDVTEQLIDFDARMKTMLAQEEVVRNMLRKSNNLSDSLTINNDLSRLRGEIESIAGQRKSLASQASYSTLELKLSQKASAIAVVATDPNWFQTSWASAWGAGTMAFRSIVSLLMWFLVFSPIWIAAFLGIKWLVKTANKAPLASASSEAQRPV
ncbi:MAG: DUF4349 domain-containing protein [Chlorobia bacterium]|nr:DUF4349 domain-containing protein [Fimbriimonadaceae bacterium]